MFHTHTFIILIVYNYSGKEKIKHLLQFMSYFYFRHYFSGVGLVNVSVILRCFPDQERDFVRRWLISQ